MAPSTRESPNTPSDREGIRDFGFCTYQRKIRDNFFYNGIERNFSIILFIFTLQSFSLQFLSILSFFLLGKKNKRTKRKKIEFLFISNGKKQPFFSSFLISIGNDFWKAWNWIMVEFFFYILFFPFEGNENVACCYLKIDSCGLHSLHSFIAMQVMLLHSLIDEVVTCNSFFPIQLMM